MSKISQLPSWFKQPLPSVERLKSFKESLSTMELHTVCESAQCPNMGECWAKGVATLMILGDVCTRRCRFCAVASGVPGPVDLGEPLRVAQAVKRFQLDYVVITSVTRDDLEDQGARHFARTIFEIRELNPNVQIEILIPDFSGVEDFVEIVVNACPDVIGHNLETVRRWAPVLRPQADYERSLSVLRYIKKINPEMVIKSGLMLGLGEVVQDLDEAMKDLVSVGCDILTLGQYLAPSKTDRHVKVERFVSPSEFDDHKNRAMAFGFRHVVSAPLVRSSYLAKEAYQDCLNFEKVLSL